MKRRVVKIGGSLLQRVDLPVCFASWHRRQNPAAQTYVVVGGGSLVDEIRKLDQRFELSDASAHWLAIRGMSITAQLFVELVPDARLVSDPDQIDGQSGLFVLDVYEFLLRNGSSGSDALPCGWHVTSDSIAAHLARWLEADELVLVKPVRRCFSSLVDAAANEFVDSYFPTAVADSLTVRFDIL
jgi:aspartokinase-like uncharacterized kinase